MSTFIKIRNIVGEWHTFIGSSVQDIQEHLKSGYDFLELNLSTIEEISAEQAGSPEAVKKALGEYSNYIGSRYFGVRPDQSQKYGTPAFATEYIGKLPSPSAYGFGSFSFSLEGHLGECIMLQGPQAHLFRGRSRDVFIVVLVSSHHNMFLEALSGEDVGRFYKELKYLIPE